MQITLVGLDNTSVSLGLALKAVLPDAQLVGNDRDRDRVKAATKAGAIDKGHWNLLNACDGADIVLINEPLAQVETDLAALATELPARAVVMVVSATQRAVQRLLSELTMTAVCLGCRFVARGLSNAAAPDGQLLQGALCYIVAAPSAPPDAVQVAINLAEAVGARPCFLDAEEHDGLTAATEQLPQLLALALLQTLLHAEAQRDLQRAVSPGLQALSDLLPTPESVHELAANSDNLPHWLDQCAAALRELGLRVRQGDTEGLASAARQAHDALAAWGQGDEPPTTETPTGLGLRQLLLGERRKGRRS